MNGPEVPIFIDENPQIILSNWVVICGLLLRILNILFQFFDYTYSAIYFHCIVDEKTHIISWI